MEYEIRKLSELEEEQVYQATSICIDGLYNVFSMLSKDKVILREIFKDSFQYDMNYACLYEGEIAGFIGIGNSSIRPASDMKLETFEKYLGKNAGMIHKFTEPAFSKIRVDSDNVVEIEFLVTSPHFRGKGIATKLIEFVCDMPEYDYCVLDVYSKNPNAIRLYEKLGFRQVKVKSEWILRLRGVGKTITMKLDIDRLK